MTNLNPSTLFDLERTPIFTEQCMIHLFSIFLKLFVQLIFLFVAVYLIRQQILLRAVLSNQIQVNYEYNKFQ